MPLLKNILAFLVCFIIPIVVFINEGMFKLGSIKSFFVYIVMGLLGVLFSYITLGNTSKTDPRLFERWLGFCVLIEILIAFLLTR